MLRCDVPRTAISDAPSDDLYGEVLQLVSDPYSEGNDFLVEVHSQRTDHNRIVRLPKFIVNSTRAA